MGNITGILNPNNLGHLIISAVLMEWIYPVKWLQVVSCDISV